MELCVAEFCDVLKFQEFRRSPKIEVAWDASYRLAVAPTVYVSELIRASSLSSAFSRLWQLETISDHQ
jgi:hypothetical protein